MSRTIHRGLTRSLLLGLGLAMVVAALVLRIMVSGWLAAEFDEGLDARAQALVSLTEVDEDGLQLDFAGEYMPEFELEEDADYFQMWTTPGVVFERSDSLESLDDGGSEAHLVLADIDELEDGALYAAAHRNVRLPDGRSGRQISVRFLPQVDHEDDEDELDEAGDGKASAAEGTSKGTTEDPDLEDEGSDEKGDDDEGRDEEAGQSYAASPLFLAVASSREGLDDRIGWLDRFLVLSTLGGLGILLLLIRGAVHSELKPVGLLADKVAQLDSSSLAHRFESSSFPTELQPIASGLNELLERLEGAFKREKRLSADLAHELRTPVAELRSLSEVGGLRQNDPATLRSFFSETRSLAIQMEGIVTTLLELARLESGLNQVECSPIELRDLVERCWRKVSHRGPFDSFAADTAKGGDLSGADRIVLEIADNVVLWSDPLRLELILTNLLDNALRYSPSDSVVVCAWQSAGAEGFLGIENRAPDLEPGDEEMLFERFWRKDRARSRTDSTTGGLGVGLNLVERLAAVLGIEIAVSIEAEPQRVVVALSGLRVASAQQDRESA